MVLLYCNYYFFALCRNLLFFLGFGNSKTFADCEFTCCVLELALARSGPIPLKPRLIKISKNFENCLLERGDLALL